MNLKIRCDACGAYETDTGVITPRVCFKCGSALGLRGHIGETWHDTVYVESIITNVEGYSRVIMIPYGDSPGGFQCIGKIIWDTHDSVKNFPKIGDCFNASMRVKDHAYRRTYVSHVKVDTKNPVHRMYDVTMPYHDMWSP